MNDPVDRLQWAEERHRVNVEKQATAIISSMVAANEQDVIDAYILGAMRVAETESKRLRE